MQKFTNAVLAGALAILAMAPSAAQPTPAILSSAGALAKFGPAISPTCEIKADNPNRVSSVGKTYRPKGNVNLYSSYITFEGQSLTVAGKRKPYIGIHIADKVPDKYSKGIMSGDAYFGDVKIEIDMQKFDEEIYDEPLTISISINNKIIHDITGKNINIYSGDVSGRISEGDNSAFVKAIDKWNNSDALTVTVRNTKTTLETVKFAKSDFTTVKNAAVSDWQAIYKAMSSGRCKIG